MLGDYQVVTVDKKTRIVKITPPEFPTMVTGIEKLFQIVVLSLLNDPGRSGLYPDDGSGLREMIGQYNVSSRDISDIFNVVSDRIGKIKKEILSYQNEFISTPLTERLADLKVLNVDHGDSFDQVRIKFRLVSQAGQNVSFTI